MLLKDQKNGSVLIYTVLLLAVMIPTGLAIADLVRTSTRAGSYVQQGMQAVYAAESGLESALYNLRKSDARLAQIDNSLSSASWFLNQQNSWRLQAQGTSNQVTIASLAPGETASVDVFDFDDPFQPYASRINLTWDGTGGEFLEAAWTGWDSQGNFNNQTTRRVFSNSNSGGAEINLEQGQTGAVAYSALIKNVSLGDDRAENIIITAYGPDGGAKDLPVPVTITSAGRFGQSQQIIQAAFPRRAPLQSLFDYVIFSECTLDKGTGNIECP